MLNRWKTFLHLTSDQKKDKEQIRKLTHYLAEFPTISKRIKDSNTSPDIILHETKKVQEIFGYTCPKLFNEGLNKVIEHGLIPYFISFLTRSDQLVLQLDSCSILVNISSSEDCNKSKLVIGAIPLLVRLMKHNNLDLATDAAWCLANLVGNGVETRDLILLHGSLDSLLHLIRRALQESFLIGLQTGSWLLSVFAYEYQSTFDQLQVALPCSRLLLNQVDLEVLSYTCDFLVHYLSFDGSIENVRIQKVLDVDIVPRVIELLCHSNNRVAECALKVVNAIASGNEQQAQVLLDHGLISPLQDALTSLLNFEDHCDKISKNTCSSREERIFMLLCQTVSNLLLGNQGQMYIIVQVELIPSFVCLLNRKGSNFLYERVCWVLTAFLAWKKSELTRDVLIKTNVLFHLTRFLIWNKTPIEILRLSLEAFDSIINTTFEEKHSQILITKCFSTEILQECKKNLSLLVKKHKDEEIKLNATKLLQWFMDVEQKNTELLKNQDISV